MRDSGLGKHSSAELDDVDRLFARLDRAPVPEALTARVLASSSSGNSIAGTFTRCLSWSTRSRSRPISERTDSPGPGCRRCTSPARIVRDQHGRGPSGTLPYGGAPIR